MTADGQIHPINYRKDDTQEFQGLMNGSFLPNGDFVFTDFDAEVIWRLRRSGELDIIAGVKGERGHRDGGSLEALFHRPWGISLHQKDILDQMDNRKSQEISSFHSIGDKDIDDPLEDERMSIECDP